MNLTRLLLLALVLAASAAQAVQFGWQDLPEGGIEYLVQVEPELIDSFRQSGFSSEVPPGLRDIRRIRISVGGARLPNQGDMTGPEVVRVAPAPSASTFTAPPLTPGAEAATRQASPADTASPGLADHPPPLLEPAGGAAPLPFFHTGPASPIDLASPEQPQAQSEGIRTEQADNPPAPRLNPDDGPQTAAAAVASTRETIGAAKPATADLPPSPSPSRPEATASAVFTGKPWLPLMVVLLGLFASLGANIYLAWIHQSLRANYWALLRGMPKAPAARV